MNAGVRFGTGVRGKQLLAKIYVYLRKHMRMNRFLVMKVCLGQEAKELGVHPDTLRKREMEGRAEVEKFLGASAV